MYNMSQVRKNKHLFDFLPIIYMKLLVGKVKSQILKFIFSGFGIYFLSGLG